MRRAYLLPNLFTSASLFCGVLALISVFRDNLIGAYWLILLGIVLDSLDGKIARLTNTQSMFGLNFDSLSDLVTFGVAPAILLFVHLVSIGVKEGVAAGVVSLYVLCGAIRLARFNVISMRKPSFTFVGLPIPAAAGIVVTTFAVLHNLNPVFTLKGLPLIVVAVAYLMVSHVKYPSGKNIHLDINEIVLLATVGVAIFWLLQQFRDILIFACFWSYLLFGVIQHVVIQVMNLQRADEIPGEDIEEEETEI